MAKLIRLRRRRRRRWWPEGTYTHVSGCGDLTSWAVLIGACGLCKDGNRERQPVAEEHWASTGSRWMMWVNLWAFNFKEMMGIVSTDCLSIDDDRSRLGNRWWSIERVLRRWVAPTGTAFIFGTAFRLNKTIWNEECVSVIITRWVG